MSGICGGGDASSGAEAVGSSDFEMHDICERCSQFLKICGEILSRCESV